MIIGEIQYNEIGSYFWEIYPGLQQGILTYGFTHDKQSYTLEVFFNLQAQSLFYNIKNRSGDLMQSQMNLAFYPTNLLVNMDFRGSYLYVKDYEIHFENL